MAKEIDYKNVLCILINDGIISMETAKEYIARSKETAPEIKTGPTWDVAMACLLFLNENIKTSGKKKSRVNQNALTVMEKLHRIDERSEQEIKDMITWAHSHDFWCSIILSPENLRKNFIKMEMQRNRDEAKLKPAPVITTPKTDKWERVIEERRKESVPMPKGFKEGLLKRTAQ